LNRPMRVVSWNMNHCLRSPALRRRAWEFLRDELRADIALVQEASPPPDLTSVYRPIDPKKPRLAWGSAIVSFRPDLTLKARPRVALADCYTQGFKDDELPDSHPGACAVADVVDAKGRFQFTAVSLYGQWEMMPNRRIYSCARLHRMISDLTAILDTSRRRPVLIAGDFNMTTQIAYERQTAGETAGAVAVFDRLKAWGLTDCFEATKAHRPKQGGCSCPEGKSCAHLQTFRLKNRKDSRGTQLDYAFISKTLNPKLRRCDVVHTDEAWSLSDHCPVVVDLA
jgi:exonuclease III